ncbi:MAG: hypothetical protein SFW35_03525 [Chitinophagales bacterium]|nr:hypothetical protein [Chitinophagales bacterium]
MKKTVILSISFLLLITVAACKKKSKSKARLEPFIISASFTGPQREYNAEGKLVKVLDYKNGKKHGYVTEYYDNGNKYKQFPYAYGVMDGVYKEYYREGQLFMEVPVEEGVFNGLMKKYHKNGQLQCELKYEYNKESLGLKEYDVNGKLITGYPEILIELKQLSLTEYQVTASLSKPWHKVEYYYGYTESDYLDNNMQPAHKEGTKSVFTVEVPPGSKPSGTVMARALTSYGNYLLLAKEI